jgi:hypothetical protein
MSGILSIVEEALEIPLLWTIDDHRKGIDCTNHLAAEEMRKLIADLSAIVPCFRKLIDFGRQVPLNSENIVC